MLRKTLLAGVAVIASVAVPAANATVVQTNASFSASTPSSYVRYTGIVDYDCSTNTFNGTGGTLLSNSGSTWNPQSQSVPDATLSGTLTQNANPVYSSVTFSLSVLGTAWNMDLSSSWLTTYFPGDSNGQSIIFQIYPSCRRFPAVTSAEECKGDGWKAVSSADDTPFNNQGDCVSYVMTKGKNAPAGS